MQKTALLSDEMVKTIKNFVEEKEREEEFLLNFPNVLIRDDVLELLEGACTVIYYPLEGERNNGFHVNDIPGKDGEYRQFVFINTDQTTDRQTFTAAHELGHVWGVDLDAAKRCGVDLDESLSEAIINRFAAELLMPEKQFRAAFAAEYKKYGQENGGITIFNLLKVIVILMNRFMTPYKAVVRRLQELNILQEDIIGFLIDNYEESDGIIKKKIDEIIEGFKYTKLQMKSKRRWIEGLAELLDYVEKEELVLPSKISNMRKAFQIEPATENKKMDEILNVYNEKDKG